MSVSHAAFFGIGAYATAIISTQFTNFFFLTVIFSFLISGTISFMVSKIANKIAKDYFLIVTLGIQVILYSIMNNWKSVTNGSLGINDIPPLPLFDITNDTRLSFFLIALFSMVIVWYISSNVVNSSFGRLLIAVGEDEMYAESLGKNVNSVKTSIFIISNLMATFAGILYAHYFGYIDPSSFSLEKSLQIFSIVIIGGIRNLKGIFIATIILTIFPESLRFCGIQYSIIANINQMIYGFAIFFIIVSKNMFQDIRFPQILRGIKIR